ncbi:MAG: hypothetical protein RL885_30915, partial [Planctomycetota bacterium]
MSLSRWRDLICAGMLLAATASGQTNQRLAHNGVDYFFSSPVLPPTNTTTITRTFGSISCMGNRSGGGEALVHGIGTQQEAVEVWNGQAGATPTVARPIGFSMLEFRRGGNFRQSTGTVVFQTSWLTSLPCTAPWFWVVTLTWGTTFTQTSTAFGATDKMHFSLRGELNQTLSNQNYFTGSGNERNLNSGGFSFLEDTIANAALQTTGAQEWSNSYYQVDAAIDSGRDPSGSSLGLSLDFGTGGAWLRPNNTSVNPGVPPDAFAFQHESLQQLNGRPQTMITLITTPQLAGGFSASASGTFLLPANDGRVTNLVSDPVLTGLGLALSTLLTTGGNLSPFTGDTGLSGVANTIPLDLSAVTVPPPLM